MLEFKKKILSKVSFDHKLFEKELVKAVRWLVPKEIAELRIWCYENYGERYREILDHCFKQSRVLA